MMQREQICRLSFVLLVYSLLEEPSMQRLAKASKPFSALTAPAVHKVVKICSLKKKIQGPNASRCSPHSVPGPRRQAHASPLTILETALLTSTHMGPALTSLPPPSSIPHFLFHASLHPRSVSFCLSLINCPARFPCLLYPAMNASHSFLSLTNTTTPFPASIGWLPLDRIRASHALPMDCRVKLELCKT
jgi:hypothetical protein